MDFPEDVKRTKGPHFVAKTPICVLFRVLKRLEEEEGGGHMVTDFVTRLMRPKYLLKKSDRRCALTQLANKKYDSITVAYRIKE